MNNLQVFYQLIQFLLLMERFCTNENLMLQFSGEKEKGEIMG